jgi:hypothetical protein
MLSQHQSFTDRTLVVSGGSRDAGLAIALDVTDLSRHGGGDNPIIDINAPGHGR